MTTPGVPAHYDATCLTLVEALRNVPLTGTMHRDALVKMADSILAQLPEASDAVFYMLGATAERERIREAAQERFDALGEGDFSQASMAVADILLIVSSVGDHFVTFKSYGWDTEHPTDCPRDDCPHYEAIRRVQGHGAPTEGRWRITGISEGLPDLERVEPQP